MDDKILMILYYKFVHQRNRTNWTEPNLTRNENQQKEANFKKKKNKNETKQEEELTVLVAVFVVTDVAGITVRGISVHFIAACFFKKCPLRWRLLVMLSVLATAWGVLFFRLFSIGKKTRQDTDKQTDRHSERVKETVLGGNKRTKQPKRVTSKEAVTKFKITQETLPIDWRAYDEMEMTKKNLSKEKLTNLCSVRRSVQNHRRSSRPRPRCSSSSWSCWSWCWSYSSARAFCWDYCAALPLASWTSPLAAPAMTTCCCCGDDSGDCCWHCCWNWAGRAPPWHRRTWTHSWSSTMAHRRRTDADAAGCAPVRPLPFRRALRSKNNSAS